MVKTLRDYIKLLEEQSVEDPKQQVDEVDRSDSLEKWIHIKSDGNDHRKAIYSLKRALDEIDVLTDFKYVGKKDGEPARGEFVVTNETEFNRLRVVAGREHDIILETLVITEKPKVHEANGSDSHDPEKNHTEENNFGGHTLSGDPGDMDDSDRHDDAEYDGEKDTHQPT